MISHNKMSITADSAEISRERFSKVVAIHYGIVVALLLMVVECLDHLRRHVGVHVKRGQLFSNGVDGLLSNSRIELNIIKLGTGRKRTDAEPPDTRRRCTDKLQGSIGTDVVSPAVNKKPQPIWCAVHNRG